MKTAVVVPTVSKTVRAMIVMILVLMVIIVLNHTMQFLCPWLKNERQLIAAGNYFITS